MKIGRHYTKYGFRNWHKLQTRKVLNDDDTETRNHLPINDTTLPSNNADKLNSRFIRASTYFFRKNHISDILSRLSSNAFFKTNLDILNISFYHSSMREVWDQILALQDSLIIISDDFGGNILENYSIRKSGSK